MIYYDNVWYIDIKFYIPYLFIFKSYLYVQVGISTRIFIVTPRICLPQIGPKFDLNCFRYKLLTQYIYLIYVTNMVDHERVRWIFS